MQARLSLLIGAVALLTACDAGVPSPSEPMALEPRFAATTTTSSIKVPTNIVIFVPCANGGAGEFIDVSGDLHILTHVTISNSGKIVVKEHFQPQGISGVGLTTGAKYQATGVTQETTHGTGTFTFVNVFRMIGQGPGNNFSVHQNIHVTVNANGDVTAEVDNTNVSCK